MVWDGDANALAYFRKITTFAENFISYGDHFQIAWFLFPNLGIGKDFSGEVILKGDAVTKYQIGDEVFGFSTIGSLQEYTITKEHLIRIIPNTIYDEILKLILVFLYIQ